MFRGSLSRHLPIKCFRTFVTSVTLQSSAADVTKISCNESVKKFLDKYDTFMFDCDGVLWENDHITPIPGVNEAIEKLQVMNKRILYVTNNSIASRNALQRKFPNHGFHSPLENIFGNGYAAAVYLKDFLKISGKVYLVGGAEMKWELDQAGINNFGIGQDADKPSTHTEDLLNFTFEDNVQAVLVGFDEYFSFNKIYKASSYICIPSCHFIATNNIERGIYIGEDPQKRRLPLTGIMVNAIAEAANREPLVVGKPNKLLFDCILRQHPKIDASRTVFVGDNLKADMGFAKNVGIDSALVLTGTSGIDKIIELPELAPTYVMNSLAAIV